MKQEIYHDGRRYTEKVVLRIGAGKRVLSVHDKWNDDKLVAYIQTLDTYEEENGRSTKREFLVSYQIDDEAVAERDLFIRLGFNDEAVNRYYRTWK